LRELPPVQNSDNAGPAYHESHFQSGEFSVADDLYVGKYANSKEDIHEQSLRLRMKRFELLAGNVANMDTPNYKARDIEFGTELERAMGVSHQFGGMITTSAGHIAASAPPPEEDLIFRVPLQTSMDGNTVEIDTERVAIAENNVRLQFSMQAAAGKYKDMQKMYQDMTP
jgi:flagellar basal-body rod protein FlgB